MCTGLEIAMIAGSVVSAGATILGGMQQAAAAENQAIATQNQADQEADAARARAEQIRKAGRAQRGEASSALASSGVKLGEGTALEVQKQITQNVEQDALSAILSGDRIRRAGEDQAGIIRAQGQAAKTGSLLSAGGTLLMAGSKWKSVARGGQ